MTLLFYFGGFSPIGGIETFARNLLLDQSFRGCKTRILCWGRNSDLIGEMESAGVGVRRSGFRWGCRWNMPDWALLPKGLEEARTADVILFGKLMPKTILAKLRCAAPNASFVFITPYRPIAPQNKESRKELCEHLSVFDEIWVQDPTFESALREIGYSRQISVAPYMPESDMPPPPYREMPLGVGFLGRLVQEKNLSLLLEAFSLFRRSYPSMAANNGRGAELHIIGGGPMRTSLARQAEAAGLREAVNFRGPLQQSNVREAISRCHLFVFTSDFEGQCLAALEVLRAGRPVVATDAGALPDILRDGRLGALVQRREAKSVAAAMRTIADRILSADIRPERVYEAYLERYGAETIGDRYADLLESVVLEKSLAHETPRALTR